MSLSEIGDRLTESSKSSVHPLISSAYILRGRGRRAGLGVPPACALLAGARCCVSLQQHAHLCILGLYTSSTRSCVSLVSGSRRMRCVTGCWMNEATRSAAAKKRNDARG